MAAKQWRKLEDVTETELAGILQRLALFESLASISSNYAYPVKVIQSIRDRYSTRIWELRRSWRSWVESIEPLTNTSNLVVFLGTMARKAAMDGQVRDAVNAALAIRTVLEKEKVEVGHEDRLLMEMVMQGDWEKAADEFRGKDRPDIPDPSEAPKYPMRLVKLVDKTTGEIIGLDDELRGEKAQVESTEHLARKAFDQRRGHDVDPFEGVD